MSRLVEGDADARRALSMARETGHPMVESLALGQVMWPDPSGNPMTRLTVGARSPMTTGPHRSLLEHLQRLVERKRFLCANEPAWARRGPRDREIAALNRQIDHLLDQRLLRRFRSPRHRRSSHPRWSQPTADGTALRKETT
jgi:hypothetical protein